jgi:hypothetical protein
MELFALTGQLPNQKAIIKQESVNRHNREQIPPPPIPTACLPQCHPNFVLPSTSWLPNWAFSERVSRTNCVSIT